MKLVIFLVQERLIFWGAKACEFEKNEYFFITMCTLENFIYFADVSNHHCKIWFIYVYTVF